MNDRHEILPDHPAGRLDRRDVRFWGATFGGLLFLAVVLHTAAFGLVPAGERFAGFFVDPGAAWSHAARARSFAEGAWLAEAPTAFVRFPGGFNLVWFLAGAIMRLTGVPFIAVWYGLGAVFGAALYLALLSFMRRFFRDRQAAWTAYVLAGFGMGFGWVVSLATRDFLGGTLVPTDLALPEAFPLVSFLASPHLSAAWCLLLVLFSSAVAAEGPGARRHGAVGGAAALGLSLVYPYAAVSVVAVLLCWHLLMGVKGNRRSAGSWVPLGIVLAGFVPAVIFFPYLAEPVEAARLWRLTGINRSPGLPQALLGFAPFLLLAFPAYRGLVPVRRFTGRYLLVACWIPVNAALHFSYPLVFFENRLVLGLVVPLAVMASWGLHGTVLPFLGRREGIPGVTADMLDGPPGSHEEGGALHRGRLLPWLVSLAVLMFLSAILLVARQLEYVRTGRARAMTSTDLGMTLRRDTEGAVARLRAVAPPGTVVLCGPATGTTLPARLPVRVVIGQVRDNGEFTQTLDLVRRFYRGDARMEERVMALRMLRPGVVWHGPQEWWEFGPPPDGFPGLIKFHDDGVVRLYEVGPGEGGAP